VVVTVEDASAVVMVAEHAAGAYAFLLRTTANAFLHRVLPLRDPAQPRFRCVVVVRCTSGGLLDRSVPAWIGQRGQRGLRRDELAATMGAIRSDPGAWLAQPAQSHLRAWLLTPDPAPPAASEPLPRGPEQGGE
jgi:hypothetical protein